MILFFVKKIKTKKIGKKIFKNILIIFKKIKTKKIGKNNFKNSYNFSVLNWQFKKPSVKTFIKKFNKT